LIKKFWTHPIKVIKKTNLWLLCLGWCCSNTPQWCQCLSVLEMSNGLTEWLIFLLHVFKHDKDFFHGHDHLLSWCRHDYKNTWNVTLTKGEWSTTSITCKWTIHNVWKFYYALKKMGIRTFFLKPNYMDDKNRCRLDGNMLKLSHAWKLWRQMMKDKPKFNTWTIEIKIKPHE
jgi:hypothetical protein